MKMQTKNIATLIAITLVFASQSIFGQVKDESRTDSKGFDSISNEFTASNSVAGSWYVIATVPTPDGERSFRGMITFAEGGGMIASAQGDILLDIQSPATAAHGAWVRTGNREFLYTFHQIIYTADGSYDGGIKVRNTVIMNKSGSAWHGLTSVEFFNANDEVVGIGTGSVTATRIYAEPLLP